MLLYVVVVFIEYIVVSQGSLCQITPVPDSAAVVPDRLTLVDLRRIVVRSRLIIDLCLIIHK